MRRRSPDRGRRRIDLDPGGAEIQRGLVAWRLCETRLDVGAVSIMPPERISLSRVWSSVERFDRDRNFGGATGVTAGFQHVADDTLVAAFAAASTLERLLFSGRLLPIHPPMFVHGKDMQVALGW